MYRPHFIEFKAEDRDKAYPIINKHYDLHNIDDYRIYEDTVGGVKRLTVKLYLYISDDLELIKDDFRKAGVELF